jgi:MYXO-CTERM domain-containing protein
MRRGLWTALAAIASALPGAAHAGIADLAGTKPGEVEFPGFVDADTCATCHGGGVAGDTSLLAADTGMGTMMANAARDPVFFAALTVANQDVPGVGSFCLHCHSPIGFVRGHATPPDGSAFDAIDRQGVGCVACHRAEESPAPGPYLLGDAQLFYSSDLAYHGPYADSMSPAHPAAPLPSLSDSRFCGQCHHVTNPEVHLRDAQGNDTGLEFPLDTTFDEWSASDYGKAGGGAYQSCIDCHMTKHDGSLPITRLDGSPLRDGPRDHAFVGGNHWGILAVKQANPDRAAAYGPAFDLAAQRTLDTLGRAVVVTLSDAPAQVDPGASFTIKVRVRNASGHKFPTGYAETRRAWVGVRLVDKQGNETPLLGGFDLATGEIQSTPATRIYRATHGRWSGQQAQPDEHLALHDVVIADTRIPPTGFTAGPTTTPSGDIDYADGKGGYRDYDEATFTLTAPAGINGDYTLSARVYYQSMTREHVEFLQSANTTDSRGDDLAAIFMATGQAEPLAIAKDDHPLVVGTSAATGSGGAGGVGGAGTTTSSGSGGGSTMGKGGCGCRTAESGSGESAAVVALALAISMMRRRRARI